jgi:hypothetical protein
MQLSRVKNSPPFGGFLIDTIRVYVDLGGTTPRAIYTFSDYPTEA